MLNRYDKLQHIDSAFNVAINADFFAANTVCKAAPTPKKRLQKTRFTSLVLPCLYLAIGRRKAGKYTENRAV